MGRSGRVLSDKDVVILSGFYRTRRNSCSGRTIECRIADVAMIFQKICPFSDRGLMQDPFVSWAQVFVFIVRFFDVLTIVQLFHLLRSTTSPVPLVLRTRSINTMAVVNRLVRSVRNHLELNATVAASGGLANASPSRSQVELPTARVSRDVTNRPGRGSTLPTARAGVVRPVESDVFAPLNAGDSSVVPSNVVKSSTANTSLPLARRAARGRSDARATSHAHQLASSVATSSGDALSVDPSLQDLARAAKEFEARTVRLFAGKFKEQGEEVSAPAWMEEGRRLMSRVVEARDLLLVGNNESVLVDALSVLGSARIKYFNSQWKTDAGATGFHDFCRLGLVANLGQFSPRAVCVIYKMLCRMGYAGPTSTGANDRVARQKIQESLKKHMSHLGPQSLYTIFPYVDVALQLDIWRRAENHKTLFSPEMTIDMLSMVCSAVPRSEELVLAISTHVTTSIGNDVWSKLPLLHVLKALEAVSTSKDNSTQRREFFGKVRSRFDADRMSAVLLRGFAESRYSVDVLFEYFESADDPLFNQLCDAYQQEQKWTFEASLRIISALRRMGEQPVAGLKLDHLQVHRRMLLSALRNERTAQRKDLFLRVFDSALELVPHVSWAASGKMDLQSAAFLHGVLNAVLDRILCWSVKDFAVGETVGLRSEPDTKREILSIIEDGAASPVGAGKIKGGVAGARTIQIPRRPGAGIPNTESQHRLSDGFLTVRGEGNTHIREPVTSFYKVAGGANQQKLLGPADVRHCFLAVTERFRDAG